MFRRVLCGLALVAMMGTVAFGAPTVTVTNAVTTSLVPDPSPPGIFNIVQYEPAAPTPIGKGETQTLYFFVDGLESATTANGGGSTILASFGFHHEESGVNLSFANPVIRFPQKQGEFQGSDLGWSDREGFGGWFPDTGLDPDVNDDIDWGASVFTGTTAAVSGTQFLGTIDVIIADDPNNKLPEDFFLAVEPARAPNPDDTTMTQTLIESPGAQPGDVVTNVEWAGLANTNLVPEPTTMALLIAGCGGGLIARRRRS